MQMTPRFRQFAMYALMLSLTPVLIAQGHSDHDRDNRGHDRVPPGQAKKYDHDDHDRDNHGRDERRMPPGQAKKYGCGNSAWYPRHRSSRRPVYYPNQPRASRRLPPPYSPQRKPAKRLPYPWSAARH